MELEHCFKYGCDLYFTTPNYNITTTPRLEWEYIVKRETCPLENCLHGRKLTSPKESMALPVVSEAKLILEEVIAVIQYTGPMVTRSHAFSRPSAILTRYFAVRPLECTLTPISPCQVSTLRKRWKPLFHINSRPCKRSPKDSSGLEDQGGDSVVPRTRWENGSPRRIL